MAGSGGGGFVQQPDMGGPVVQCDVWAQDCPAGEKCSAWADNGGSSWNAAKCTPVDPNPVGPGETCLVQGNGVSGVDNCVKGAMCFNVDTDTLEGTCVPLCTCSPNTPVCADTTTSCVISNGGVLNLCLPLCDPLDASPCDAGQVCIPNPQGAGFVCLIDASGGTQPGDPCEFANVCPAGTICANADAVQDCFGAVGCCAPVCDVTAPPDCPGANEECVPFYNQGEAPMCLENLGVCTLPA